MAVIGDVVGSREHPDRAALDARLQECLDQINRDWSPQVPLRVTVGDEFQGAWHSRGPALRAALRIRLELLPEIDLRVGLGVGGVSVLREQPRVEDGPGWWSAREAIDFVKADASRPQRHTKMGYRGPDQALVNAVLVGLDALIAPLDARSVVLARGLLAGCSRAALASEVGISASAVSQRIGRHSLGAIERIDALLAELSDR